MARISKSNSLKSGLYMSVKHGKLIELQNPWLELFYDKTTSELIYLDTVIYSDEKVSPVRVIFDKEDIDNLVYIGKV